ncbi:MAG: molybdopterin-synthase adenylyltransferase MoeB [Acidobacteria bacterium]|nr:molybdopterin-synthase adenylyltransferase MoeB [Acidobacteriota bacterium]
MSFSQQELQRYSRHLVLPEVGLEGQTRLRNASVLCVGAGGLGSPLLLYLAAAGVGRLGIVDFDAVDFSNLQRQILHSEGDLGHPKVDSAKRRLESINSDIEITTYPTRLTRENALDIISAYDIVADGTDNFATRYLVNDACVKLGKINIYGSIFRFEGQVSVFDASRGPCYRCLYPEPPPPGAVPSCAEGGVLGVLPGIVGSLQAAETIKVLLGRGEPLIGRLMLIDVLRSDFRFVKLRKNPKCPVCQLTPSEIELIDYDQFCGVGRGEESEGADLGLEVTVVEVNQLLKQSDRDVCLIDVREPEEYAICRIDGARLIPLGELPRRLEEIDSTSEILIHCHSGGRSLSATRFLRRLGYPRVRSVKGGIDAWSKEIDSGVPRY